MRKKILSSVLAFAMTLTMIPTALAASNASCSGDDSCTHEAKIGTTHYDTLEEALKTVQTATGDVTIDLLHDATVDSADVSADKVGGGLLAFFGSKKLTINFNDNDILIPDSCVTYTAFYLKDGATLELNGPGKLTNNSTEGGIFCSAGKCTVTIGAGMVLDTFGAGVYTGNSVTGTSITINGTMQRHGTHTSHSQATVQNSGNASGVTITINEGAEIYGGKDASDNYAVEAVYAPAAGTLTVNGGTIIGRNGIYAKGADVVINGGTITGTGTRLPYTFNGSGSDVTGDGVVTDNCTGFGNYKKGSLTINNGMITGTKNAVAAYRKDSSVDLPTVTINGGSFSTNPLYQVEVDSDGKVNSTKSTNFIPAAKSVVQTEAVGYSVADLTASTADAKIGNTLYNTIQNAITTAQKDDTVTLLRDTGYGIEIGTGLTLDGNGHTHTGSLIVNATDNVTLKGLTVTGGVALNSGAKATIEDGYYQNTLNNNQGTLVIKGGYFVNDPSGFVETGYYVTTSDKAGYTYQVVEGTLNVEVDTGDTTVSTPEGAEDAGITSDITTALKSTEVKELGALANTAAAKSDALTTTTGAAVTEDVANAALEAANITPDQGAEVDIVLQTYVDIQPKSYDATEKTLTVDLSVNSKLVAKTTANSQAAETDIPNTTKPVDTKGTPVTITFKLPSGFVTSTNDALYIKHTAKDGVTYEYKATITQQSTDYYATFTNPHGFSEFVLSKTSNAVATVGDTSYMSYSDAITAAYANSQSVTILVAPVGGMKITVTAPVTFLNGAGITLTEDDFSYSGYNITTVTNGFAFTAQAINYPPNWTPGDSWWNGNTGNTGTTTPGTSDDKKDDAKDEIGKADAIMTETEAAMIVAQFADVKTDSWFYDEILWAVQHGVMNGRSTAQFDPNASMTYLEVVTAMARYAGETIDGEDWASKALAWGIANGITDGSDSDALITRERLVTLLARLAEKQGMTLSANGNLTAFPDNADLSDWAADAMKWAVGEGLINGMDGALNPKGNTTRAQVVTVLMRFAALAE